MSRISAAEMREAVETAEAVANQAMKEKAELVRRIRDMSDELDRADRINGRLARRLAAYEQDPHRPDVALLAITDQDAALNG